MISDLTFLRKTILFADLPPRELERVGMLMQERKYSKNQIVFLEEEAGQYMYLVKRGQVKVTKMADNGKERILTIHKEGDSFGELSLLDNSAVPATVTAMSPAIIWCMSKPDFLSVVLNNHRVMLKVVQVLSKELRKAWSQIQLLTILDAESRIRTTLIKLSQESGIPTTSGVQIRFRLTHQEIGDMAATSRETVTRFLTVCQKHKVLSFDGNNSIVLHPGFFHSRSASPTSSTRQ
ncbi:MAG: Crp/Fnr family transcriptional regulator [Acidobacteriia bacterium]|nr:Crp/Fnr family transcriptional regulator [Terriglobia bacterium]